MKKSACRLLPKGRKNLLPHLANEDFTRRLFKAIVPFFILLLFLLSCSPTDRQEADRLNDCSYAYHYRSLDSTEYYAYAAYQAAVDYPDGMAEALNNQAFVHIARMQYDEARKVLNQIPSTTDNQLELMVGYIQQMRLCQRMSQNRLFYDYREQAMRAMRRIEEELPTLSYRQQMRLIYAESELAIVNSTYYYYIGLERQSADALMEVPYEVERDTAQWLNYLYNIGAGGMITEGTQEEINQTEFDHLLRCLLVSRQAGIGYFTANSLEALAEHLMVPEYRTRLMTDNLPAFKFINTYRAREDSLALYLAWNALELFSDFGDVYQIAGAHRTLASCYRQIGQNEQALSHLEQALSDTVINKAPDLVASIREQLSVAYAAIDDKQLSDQNRNIYLELQEQTRQDRSLEARAGQLETAVSQLNTLLLAVVGTIVLLIIILAMFYYSHKRQNTIHNDEQTQRQVDEELNEQLALAKLHIEKEQRLNLEQRAKISLVNSIMPFIDRILYVIQRAQRGSNKTATLDSSQVEYLRELTDKINEQNDILTSWIQLRQGELSLNIETFELQPLFDVVAMGRSSFSSRGIALDIKPTEARVKADRVLTLFMLNTLADNARKYSQEGGVVTIEANDGDDYIDISVTDNGIGMEQEQADHLFDRKVIADETSTPSGNTQQSHGFGLINCKGIIDKYRKISRIFKVCRITVESQKGKGSRFSFRLPKGVVMTLLALLTTAATNSIMAYSTIETIKHELTTASAFADSTRNSNADRTYQHTLSLADSCRKHLNTFYILLRPGSNDTLMAINDPSVIAPEIIWLHDNIHFNYDIVLTLRNESAVAALALHQWTLYQYNNRIYTQLFKELSADSTLDDYCRKMQQSQTNKQIAIVLLVLLLLSILSAVAWQAIRSMRKAATRQQQQQEQQEIKADEIARAKMDEEHLHVSNAVLDNCLSALKHETMYYPSRIRQLLDNGDTESLAEVVAYYRELYAMLSLQAVRQTEKIKLRLRPLDNDILGDEVLIRFLFELLRKQSGQRTLDIAYQQKDHKYVECTISMPKLKITTQQAALLFTPTTDNIPFMLCRQIVRDHGEATNLRACAIRAELRQDIATIIITLPMSRHKKSVE